MIARLGSAIASRSPVASRMSSFSITWPAAGRSCFPPLDEDYGFVTAEAFASRKAVITCRD